MGLGDAKLMSVVGFWFGWISLPYVIFLSSFTALFFAIPLLMNKTKKMSSAVPFGPYIISATIIFIIFSNSLKRMMFF